MYHALLGTRRSALLSGVVPLPKLVDSGPHGAFFGVLLVRQAIALLQLDLQKKRELATSIADMAARTCTKRKVAPLLREQLLW